MKKFILPFVFCLLPFISKSQVFIIGGKGILNYSTFMNDAPKISGKAMDKVFTLGGQGGIYFRYYFNEKTYYSNTNISLAVELLFGGYGQNYKLNLTDTAVHFNTSISSMDIPVLVHVRGQAGLYAEAGVSFGMISGVKQEFSLDPETNPVSGFSGSVDSMFTTSNLSGIFGFGIDSELSDQLNLTIGFRITYGLTDLTEPQKKYSTDYKETHSANVGLVVGLGYILNFYHDYH
jgi:hypothetical protein